VKRFIPADDLGDLAIAVAAQRRGQQVRDGGTLRRGEIAHPQALSLEDPGGQV
jgi:hypothetical protein